eukprot:3913761-Rhodomonas_salina.1
MMLVDKRAASTQRRKLLLDAFCTSCTRWRKRRASVVLCPQHRHASCQKVLQSQRVHMRARDHDLRARDNGAVT